MSGRRRYTELFGAAETIPPATNSCGSRCCAVVERNHKERKGSKATFGNQLVRSGRKVTANNAHCRPAHEGQIQRLWRGFLAARQNDRALHLRQASLSLLRW